MPVETRAEFDRIFGVQRNYRWTAKTSTAAHRVEMLGRLRTAILRHAEEVDAALHRDLRKPLLGKENPEVASAILEIDIACAELADWMQPQEVEPSPRFAGNRTYVMREARGVCLLFGPWNFAFGLVFSPLVAILAAGNTAIVKPNEMQPNTSRVIAQIIREAFEEREVAVIEGDVSTAEALLDLPFDHIFFTGSPAVGKRIMARAAEHLTTVTLELGGKNPAILDHGVDLDLAAEKIVRSRYYNGGQICLAADHIWVPEDDRERLIEALQHQVQAIFYTDGVLNKAMLARMVDRRNLDRVASYIDDARNRGARIIGGAVEIEDLTIHPTIVTDVPLEAEVMRHEVFGPVLPVLGYRSVDEALAFIEQAGKPLALYIFSPDDRFVAHVLDHSSSGGVTINDTNLHSLERRLPFGGVNQSGIGAYRGIHGFRELSHARSVFVKLVP